ncbi:MAG TPA: AAA family ATPase, partial [Candidatus Eisenbacteria bacterium]|nr:AAA family ATPase [Candidatus Eisenbacteria bacterium]
MSRRTDVPDPVLFGRETELGQVREFIVRREGSPASLLLVGEPGIGKSSIWTAGLAMARSAGVTVLQHRAVQAEAAWAFAGLGDLLGDAIGDVLPALAQPRSRALSVALLLEDPGEFPSDPHALGLATRDALRLLAARNPVLIAIDDLQWLDPGSSAVLASAVRRGADERVGLLATSRVPAQSSATGLEAVFASSARVIGIGPLSLTALSHLLAAELELHLARPRLTQLWELTSGNPLFALEIGRELVRTRSVLEPGQPPPVSDDLQVLLAARLARLSPDTRRVLTTAAAMTRPTVDALARIHGEPRVATAIAEATVQSIAAVRGGRVHFAHPLHASVALGQLSTGDRRRLHRRIAAEADDLEDRARHLALASGPGAEVARI